MTDITRLEALIAEWDASHADWCCANGCAAPNGMHLPDDSVQKLLENNFQWTETLPLTPCPGRCSCDVGLYVESLREILAEIVETEAARRERTREEMGRWLHAHYGDGRALWFWLAESGREYWRTRADQLLDLGATRSPVDAA
jgi:hypothetical protein